MSIFKSVNTDLIILGHKNIGEADKLIFSYSKIYGKLKFVAKGSRRLKSKFTGHLETLNISNAQIYLGPHSTLLTEIKTLQNSKAIRNNLNKLYSALQIAEITERTLYEKQIIPDLFPLLTEAISELKNTNKSFLISISYISKFLNLLGLLPNFKEINTKLDPKFIKFYEFIKIENFSEIIKISLNPTEAKKIKNITKTLIEFQTDYSLKSLSFPTS